ncbi:MAG TPA: CHASE domain-containing protein [Burkholderiaceae bacterium]|nr:CHASE domain-containing protein [Burkholderiaceae bacterium]
MTRKRNSIRLFAELIAIVALMQVGVMLALPHVVGGLTSTTQVFLGAALLVLLAGPTIYWRCMVSAGQTIASAPSTKSLRSTSVRSAIAMTAAAQLLGLAVTAAGVSWQLRNVSEAAQEKFERRAERIERDIRRHFALAVYGLNGLGSAFAADAHVTRSQFRNWVDHRKLPTEFPGVRGFGFIERVKRDDLETFVAAQRAEGRPEFSVDTAGNAPDLYVVKYIEPAASNRTSPGKDVGREPVRREAVERAVRTGAAALSGSVTLALNNRPGPGFLYFVPVYPPGSDPASATPEQRQAMATGLLYAPLMVSEVMKGTADAGQGSLDIELYDSESAQAADLMFDSRRDASGDQPLVPKVAGDGFESLRRFNVGGRTLTLRTTSTPAFEAAVDHSSVAFIAVGGALASFLLALAVWLLAVGRVRAQRRAQRMTNDLARLARVVQHTSNSVAISDAQMRITWVNAGFTRITGYTLEDAVGRTPSELLASGKADAATIKALLDGVATGTPCRVEVLNRAKDGREYWIDTEVQPTRDENGVLVGFMEIGTDVTERRALDKELRHSNELLREALVRAEQASVAKSQFLANMSHEIRTPMNAILGMLGLLHKTELTPRQLDYATKTEGAARSLLGLLNDILDFSKAEAGKMTLDPHPFRLDRMLRDLSVILSANVGARNIDVLFDIDPAVPRCLIGDDTRLQQVLINLGGNAIKFTTEGEVVLSVRVVERGASDVLLEFAVRDSGIGIAPENQARIFTGFTQAEASTTRRFGGTGLGLAICQRLVGLMGGELHLRSALGAGSKFHFRLRVPVALESDDTPAVLRPDVGPLRALIVDDNASAREVFAGMAESLGWQADVATSGAQAIMLATARAVEGRPYETVFIDWQMPDLDGWQTCRRLLNSAQTSGQAAPLLFMVTSHGREALAQRSADEQAILSSFLVKPVTASMLFDAVADARVALAHPQLLNRPSAPLAVQRLGGLHLLVVEDNPNNQQVAEELLAIEGAQVTLADNGRLAVDLVAAADPPFDAVLMDLQMPVMDGYTATVHIRRQLNMSTLPIIAMTANAMASDREACLAAGMNDHVGKPFDLSNLVTTLLRHTGRRSSSDARRRPLKEAASAEVLEAAQQCGIDLTAALNRMGGNVQAYLRSLQSFSKELADLPDRLMSLLREGRFDESKRLMHTIKGLAGTVGVKQLANVAADGERRFAGAEAGAPQDEWLEQLRTAIGISVHNIDQITSALQQMLQPTPQASRSDTDDALADVAALRRWLDELSGLLRAADMRAIDVYENLQQSQPARIREALKPLDEAMSSLDFDQALSACRALEGTLIP